MVLVYLQVVLFSLLCNGTGAGLLLTHKTCQHKIYISIPISQSLQKMVDNVWTQMFDRHLCNNSIIYHYIQFT